MLSSNIFIRVTKVVISTFHLVANLALSAHSIKNIKGVYPPATIKLLGPRIYLLCITSHTDKKIWTLGYRKILHLNSCGHINHTSEFWSVLICTQLLYSSVHYWVVIQFLFLFFINIFPHVCNPAWVHKRTMIDCVTGVTSIINLNHFACWRLQMKWKEPD